MWCFSKILGDVTMDRPPPQTLGDRPSRPPKSPPLPVYATSHWPLCSFDRCVLFVLRVRTTLARTRFFATIGPSQSWGPNGEGPMVAMLSLPFFCNHSPLYLFLHPLPSSKPFYTLGVFALGALLECLLLWEALYKLINTIVVLT